MRYCIVHNPLLLQPMRHWFTFIFRKHEHLAVGSSGRGLTRSRGRPPFVVALPSPFVPLLYHTLRGLSRGFWNFFQRTFFTRCTHSPIMVTLVGSPLDFSYIVSYIGRFVKGFLWNFFKFLLPFSLESEWIGVTRLPRISSWRHYNTITRSENQDGKIHKNGKIWRVIFVHIANWQIAGGVV